MKTVWQTKKVSEIAEHSLGKMLDKAKNKGDLKPYLRNLNVRWFGFDLSDVLEMRFLPEEAAKYTAVKGDVLICEGGYPGRAAIWEQNESIYFQKALHRVRFHEPERSKWFLYYLHARDVEGTLKNHFNGAGIQHFTGEALAQFEVPLPPLPEQKRIVGILDEAFDGIAPAKANAEKNLQNSRALFESYLESVFTQRGEGWLEKKLGEVAESISTGPFGTMLHKSDYIPDGIPLVNPVNIVDSRIVPSNRMMVSKQTRKRLNAYVLKAGDIVVARRGELGRCALITEEQSGWLCGTGSFFLRLSNYMDGKFFVALFSSKQFRVLLENNAIGTTMSNLNHAILNDLPMLVPSISEQRSIMAKADILLSEVERLESIYQQKLAALDALKKSLLHQAFSGQL
jgi:type I restriction enzyme S subunit